MVRSRLYWLKKRPKLPQTTSGENFCVFGYVIAIACFTSKFIDPEATQVVSGLFVLLLPGPLPPHGGASLGSSEL